MINQTENPSETVHQAKKEASLNSLLHRKAFENSLQPNIIFTVPKGTIIRVNKAACKLFLYSKKEFLKMNRADIFSVSDVSYKKMTRKRKEDGRVKAEIAMIKKSGKKFPCEVTSVIFKDKAGIRNSIVNIVDLSERQNRQDKIDTENKKIVADNIVIAQSKSDSIQLNNYNWMQSVAQTTYDIIWDWDIAIDEIYFGNNYDKVFGYNLSKNRISFKEWINLFKPEERGDIKRKFDKALTLGKRRWQVSFQFVCPDTSLCHIVCRAKMLYDARGKAIRAIGIMHDTSKVQRLKNSLEIEIKMKETELTQAVADAVETERSELGKELHDNINQLLGTSVLYLDIAREDVKGADIYVIHALEYIRSAIDEIRKLSKGLTTDIIKDFGLTGAIYKMSRDTMQSSSMQIHCALNDSFEHELGEKFKLNAFRILQEQLNNIIKHAAASKVRIQLSQTNKEFIVLSISDNGKGFDTSLASQGIGLNNIINRAKLFQGTAHFISQPQKGCKLTVRFPKGDASIGT